MFGIVAVLGLNNQASEAQPVSPEPSLSELTAGVAVVAPPPVEVRVHLVPASTESVAVTRAATNLTDASVASVQAEPIELTANPVVRTVTIPAPAQVQAAPAAPPVQAATTSGSS